MYDVISVLFVLVFFGLCVLYTHACDRILGPEELAASEPTEADPSEPADEAVAA